MVGGLKSTAHAAPPTFPDNILVFPDRDFVTIEGFQNFLDKNGTVEVVRNGQVVGSAIGKVAAGDVAFEVNHPGGYCWGAGTGLNVTPNIVAGDKVQISFDGAVVADTIVGDASVTAVPTITGSTVTITGFIGPNVNPAFLEQRVINPDLTATDVGRRDIRAIPGPLTPAPKGGYSSSLVVSAAGVATATYVFNTAATAQLVAAGGGERMMSWQVQDADGNRQGMTIAEFGEVGGPGVGGCPAGPGDIAAPQPGAAAAVRSTDRTSITVKWTAATPIPGAAAISGYSVVAIAQTMMAGVPQFQTGYLMPASATTATITGLSTITDYKVEVRSISGTQLSAPLSTPILPMNTGNLNPTIAAPGAQQTPAGVTFVNIPTGAEVYYTLDLSDPRLADMPAANALLYRNPIAITAANTTVTWFAMTADGTFSNTLATQFSPLAAPAPAAPTGVTVVGGDASAAVSWVGSLGTPTPTSYRIVATPAAGTPITQDAGASARTATITGLTNNVTYNITVIALAGTAMSAPSTPAVSVKPVVSTTDRLTISQATWKSGDFRIDGTGTIDGANLQVYRANTNGTVGAAIVGATAQVTLGAYTVRLRNNAAPGTNPGTIFVKSDKGGQAGPISVSNK